MMILCTQYVKSIGTSDSNNEDPVAPTKAAVTYIIEEAHYRYLLVADTTVHKNKVTGTR